MVCSVEDDPSLPHAQMSRRNFLKIGLTGAGAGVALATAAELPVYGSMLQKKGSQVSALQAQAQANTQLQTQLGDLTTQTAGLQTQIDLITGFLYLNTDEQSLLEAIVETIIPSDTNGPGAKEAGVIYFIDRQLAADYGTNGTMYMQGPFVLTGQKGPLTVDGITYPEGTPTQGVNSGTRYQYAMDMRYFWRYGLDAFQGYVNGAYGGDFESLGGSKQEEALTDIWNNKPTSFNQIAPVDFAFELFFMTWSGFLTDPLHGGNRGMVGWQYVAFNGTNQGNFYGEGHSPLEVATSTTPIRLKPASLAQFQQQEPVL